VARLLADENVPQPVVEELRRHGHDVATLFDLGQANLRLPDDEVLALAVTDGRAVLTLNRRDFIRLHQEVSDHAGIVVCSFDLEFERQATRISDAVAAEPGLAGRLVRVNRPG